MFVKEINMFIFFLIKGEQSKLACSGMAEM